jgi:hypothetical protein
MKLATMRKLLIEADPSTGMQLKERQLEWGAVDCVVVRRAGGRMTPSNIDARRQGGMYIEAVADSQGIDAILDQLSGSFGDNAYLDVFVSDMFGYPLFRWHHAIGKRDVPREIHWASQFLTI